ncbi:MAG: hypothetical protein M1828_004607 [Chrysothrix sp. TS-e1954]|nr:MAG: hypothetical protein M1828_004607 [Chrysothrix sp. TS-e1954]
MGYISLSGHKDALFTMLVLLCHGVHVSPKDKAIQNQRAFNASANDNLAVYFGHSPRNENATLIELCNDTAINIVILGFVRKFHARDEPPEYDITGYCTSVSYDWYGCKSLASQVQACQTAGVKVFMSIGGSRSSTSFASASDAEDAATTLWNVFGAGFSTLDLRPFGPLSLDGFDIDHENGGVDYYDVFVNRLSRLYDTVNRTFYLSTAQLCANKTVILPQSKYTQADFVWVRFYNAPSCNVGEFGFLPSLMRWYQVLKQYNTPEIPWPKMYIGALSFSNNESGFVNPNDLAGEVALARAATSDIFGGIMLWDGTNGLKT